MCEFNYEAGEISHHDYATYTCPKCHQEYCWGCNPDDQSGSWHGEKKCPCGHVFVEGRFE